MRKRAVSIFGLVLLLVPAWIKASQPGSTVIPYPPYPGAPASPMYTVTVNGQPVFVHNFLTYNRPSEPPMGYNDYAHFAMAGKATIQIAIAKGKALSCRISPRAYGIEAKLEGNTATFELDRPRYLLVFINDPMSFTSNGLILFAESPEQNAPKLGDPGVFDVRNYGVDMTGKTVQTEAINRAVAEISARPGGGILYFPKGGVYRTGTILMKSRVKLYVEAGALIQGSNQARDYLPLDLTDRPVTALIAFVGVEGAGLLGRGTIDGDGYPALHANRPPGIRGYLVWKSRDIAFDDLMLRRSCMWTVHIVDSDVFASRNIKIINRKLQYNEDVYDFDCSRHCRVENGFALTMDDFFALKGTWGTEGRPVEDIVIKGFVGYGFDSGLAVGYEKRECKFSRISRVLLEDVHFVSNQVDYAIWIAFTRNPPTGYQKDEVDRSLEDFRFARCTFEEAGAIYISGGAAPLKDFVFEDCVIYDQIRPSVLNGNNFSPVFKNLRVKDKLILSAEELKRVADFDVAVPAKFLR
jgi:hypothetical protein